MSFHAPLVIDIAGKRLTAVDRKRLSHPLVGGLILFGRNWESRAQLGALCKSIKRLRPDLLICVDHEGGRVQRFKTDGFTHVPPMRALGDMWLDTPRAGAQGRAAGRGARGGRLRLCAGCRAAGLWRGL